MSLQKRGSQRLGSFLILLSLLLALGVRWPVMYPGLWGGGSSTPTSAQELCRTWNQFHSQGRRQEVRSGYFVVSLVNKLWGHILFPFLSLLWVTYSATQSPFPRPAPPNWLILWANSQQELKARTPVSWGMDLKGSRKIKNAGQMPSNAYQRLFFTLPSEYCSGTTPEEKRLRRKSKTGFEQEP